MEYIWIIIFIFVFVISPSLGKTRKQIKPKRDDLNILKQAKAQRQAGLKIKQLNQNQGKYKTMNSRSNVRDKPQSPFNNNEFAQRLSTAHLGIKTGNRRKALNARQKQRRLALKELEENNPNRRRTGNKGRSDWGTRGDNPLTSSKAGFVLVVMGLMVLYVIAIHN